MKLMPLRRGLPATLLVAMLGALYHPGAAPAVTTVFFDSSQTTNLVASGATWDTIGTEGYLFTATMDKLFTGGGGVPIGRALRVLWPAGLEAQAVTAGPVLSGARFMIARQDNQLFAMPSLRARLLASTAGAGGSIEIMPLLNGEDGFPNPLALDATGNYGQEFAYDTPSLTGFDAYKITLYVDFALMSLTVVDASLPPPPVLQIQPIGGPALQLSWPTNADGYLLEAATDISAPVWDPVTNSVVTSGNRCIVQVEVVGSQQLFRLRK